jgi:hypothetical protein
MGEGIRCIEIHQYVKSLSDKIFGPKSQLRVTSGKVKGGAKDPFTFSGFQGLKEPEGLTSGIVKSQNLKYLFGQRMWSYQLVTWARVHV